MNTFPIVKSKLTTPELPTGMLYSNRLKDFLIENKRITVITAQSGFGKTSTVLLALKTHRENIRWYRMEKEDSFLPIFYTHLIETLFQGRDKRNLDCHRALTGVQDLSKEYPIINARICQDAADLSHGNKPIYLSFDDFHNVAENIDIVESLRYFAVNLPEFISIVVTSRTETNILTGKLSVSKTALSISESHLRFTKDEAQKLILSIYKMKYSDQEIDFIFQRSEGWIAGLSMLCHNHMAAGTETTETRENIFKNYFREFFFLLERSRQDILSDLSILPDFSAEEIRSLFGYEQAEELLNWLERSNLYVQKLPLETVRFRFHSLFRQELADILLERVDKEELNQRYRKAANYYADRGEKAVAIKLLLHIGETGLAMDLAEKECRYNFQRGKLENMADFINGFSEAVIAQSSYLMFFKSITYQNVNHEISLNYAMRALRMFAQRKDTSYLMNAFGMVLVITFQTNSFEKLKEAAEYLPIGRIVARGGEPLIKLLVSIASGMVADEKFAFAARLYKILDRMKIDDPVWNYSYFMIRGVLLYRTGKLEESMRNFELVRNHPVGRESDRWKITGMVAGHLVLNLKGDHVKSKSAMAEFSILGEEYDSSFARGFTYRMAAFINYQTNDLENAIENMEKSAEAFEQSISPTLESVSRITKYFWMSNVENAEEMVEKAMAELENMENYEVGHGFYELCQTMLGALSIKSGRFEQAEKMLLSALETSEKKKACQSICGTLIQLANLFYHTGDEKRLEINLRKWARLAVKNKFTYYWEAERETLIRMCALACKYNIHPNFMASTMGIYFGMEASKRLQAEPSLIAQQPELLIEQSQIHEQHKKKVKVKLFGKFKITADDFEITDEAFKTRKISGILKYILIHTDKAVSRDALAGIFWPESDEKSAFVSLRVALSELRKILSKCDMAFDGPNALLRENKSGFCVDDNNDVVFDITEFSSLYEQYKATGGSDRKRTELLKELILIYEGDLLEDNLYDDWIVVLREYYRSIFIEASYALAGAYINESLFDEGEMILNKHLKIEPLDEKACGMLLKIFQITGQENRAEAYKRQFEKRFFVEMGHKAKL